MRLPTSLSTTPRNTLSKAITASVLPCRVSAEPARDEGDTKLRLRSTGGLEKLSAARYGVFNWILQAEFARCTAVAGRPRQGLAMFERAEDQPGRHPMVRSGIASHQGWNWPWATMRELAVGRQYFLRAHRTVGQTSAACRGRSGPRPALRLPKSRSGERRPRGERCKLFMRNFGKALRPPIYGWPDRC